MQNYSCIYHFYIKRRETVTASTKMSPNWDLYCEALRTHQEEVEIMFPQKAIRYHNEGQHPLKLL